LHRRCTLIAFAASAWVCAPLLANGSGRDPDRAGPVIGVGWRGDGSGRYPEADPPLRWGWVAKSVAQLRAQADGARGIDQL